MTYAVMTHKIAISYLAFMQYVQTLENLLMLDQKYIYKY